MLDSRPVALAQSIAGIVLVAASLGPLPSPVPAHSQPEVSKGAAPSAAEAELQGVWRIAEVVVAGSPTSSNDDPWPSLVIFTKKHFSFIGIDGVEPRPTFRAPAVRGKPTDAEKLAMFEQWNLFTANAGTYDTSGSTLGLRPIVGKTEVAMGYRVTHEFKLEGDTLWLTSKPQPGGPPGDTRRRLVRLE